MTEAKEPNKEDRFAEFRKFFRDAFLGNASPDRSGDVVRHPLR
jgi:hypothetical protein